MKDRLIFICSTAIFTILITAIMAFAQPGDFEGSPQATIDLATDDGVTLVNGQWRYSDTKIIETNFTAPGEDGQPSGRPVKTYDYTPHAGATDFDDSAWQVIEPAGLIVRRGAGRICFNWYRINLTVPERIGDFDPTGSTAVFETSIDDYAEVWVDGELPRSLGQNGGSVVAGWNASNRLVAARNVRPGQKIQLAIFGMNGPISNPPTNFIWMRQARLHFFNGSHGPVALPQPAEVNVEVDRKDASISELISANPKIHKLAEGFEFIEGPVWVKDGRYLLFSDPNANRIYKYTSDGKLTVVREKSGYDGADVDMYKQPGSNGLALDAEGRLTINEHGNRRVTRLEKDGTLTVLADQYKGKRLNSPNDLAYKSDGTLYFTDPPFGLPKFYDDPRKELKYSGIYSLKNGKLRLESADLSGPNGLAFSPDEKYLYVGNWDPKRKVVMRYEVHSDGSLQKGEVFFDMTSAPYEEAIDGVKVDERGNLYVSGPGGLWIISPGGKHLGTVKGPKLPANFAWGDEDGQTLYMTARTGLYRMRFNVAGASQSASNNSHSETTAVEGKQ